MQPSLKKYAAVKITEKPRHHHHKDFMASVYTPVHESYYYKTFEVYNGNSRKTWETINEVTRRKSDKAAINELELNGTRITNSTEIAEGFNTFFAEIGLELSRDIEEVGTSFD